MSTEDVAHVLDKAGYVWKAVRLCFWVRLVGRRRRGREEGRGEEREGGGGPRSTPKDINSQAILAIL